MTVPDFLAHLRRHGDYPIPFTVYWTPDGKPDFRVVDPDKIITCARKRLCGICGRALGERSWFIGGPLSKANHLFVDPPMHERCARFALSTCPFLAQRHEYSSRSLPAGAQPVALHSDANKASTGWLLAAWTKKTRLLVLEDKGALLFKAGTFIKQELVYSTQGEER